MKITAVIFIIILLSLSFSAHAKAKDKNKDKKACSAALNYEVETIDGKKVNLCQFQGSAIMVVNTATRCSFTRQLGALQDLYLKYKDKGFVVLGFPTNDYGEMDPLSNEEVKTFCKRQYGVTFPLFALSSIDRKKGNNSFFMKLYKKIGIRPQWNFYKYFINRQGVPEKAFDSNTSPRDPRIVKMVESLL